jgi:DNA-binding beta-propeller fold protein YncE
MSVIDTATNTVASKIPVDFIMSAAITPNGTSVYAPNYSANVVYVIPTR